MKKVLIGMTLLGSVLLANETLSIKDISLQEKATEQVHQSIKLKKCPEFTEQRLGKIENYRGLKSYTTMQNEDNTYTTNPDYGDFKIGSEVIVKVCEGKNGTIELDIEKNSYDIPNIETAKAIPSK